MLMRVTGRVKLTVSDVCMCPPDSKIKYSVFYVYYVHVLYSVLF